MSLRRQQERRALSWLGGVLLPELGEHLGFPEGRWSLWKVSDLCVDLGSVSLFHGALGAGCGPESAAGGGEEAQPLQPWMDPSRAQE